MRKLPFMLLLALGLLVAAYGMATLSSNASFEGRALQGVAALIFGSAAGLAGLLGLGPRRRPR